MTRALRSIALKHIRPAHSSQAGRPLLPVTHAVDARTAAQRLRTFVLKRQQMPTERELDTAIFWRFSLEDLRAIGLDNEIVEGISRLLAPAGAASDRAEELLGG